MNNEVAIAYAKLALKEMIDAELIKADKSMIYGALGTVMRTNMDIYTEDRAELKASQIIIE